MHKFQIPQYSLYLKFNGTNSNTKVLSYEYKPVWVTTNLFLLFLLIILGFYIYFDSYYLLHSDLFTLLHFIC